MRTRAASVQIAANPAAVLDIVCDLHRLPRRAVGFARAVQHGPAGASRHRADDRLERAALTFDA